MIRRGNNRLATKHLLDRIRYIERKLEQIEALLLCVAERVEVVPSEPDIIDAIKIAIVESTR